MKNSNTHMINVFLLLIAGAMTTACGGTKILKEEKPLVIDQSIASASNGAIEVDVDWVIVRDGPGTWAKNADWDQYLITVRNRGNEEIRVTGFEVIDSLGFALAANDSRSKLVKGSKKTSKRYRAEGVKTRAGLGAAGLMAAGGVAYVGGMSLGAATVYGGSAMAAGTAVTGILVAPVLVTGGIIRGVNNGKVNRAISERQTDFPALVGAGSETGMEFFVSLAPSPQEVRISYEDASGSHTMSVVTAELLAGLHIELDEPHASVMTPVHVSDGDLQISAAGPDR